MRRTLIVLPFLVLLIAGCTFCSQLGGRRPADQPTATPETPTEAVAVEPTPDAAGIERALNDPNWRKRMSAAHLPSGRGDIPLDRRVAMLAAALAQEIDTADPTPVDQSYLTVEGVMRLRLVRSLGDLGSEAIPELRELAEGAAGDTRISYLIALGYMGDEEVAPALREALQTSDDAVIRMDAARALGLLGDREAIPVLQDALDDPYVAEANAGLGPYRIYPVREQAAGALEALGVTVERSGATFTARP